MAVYAGDISNNYILAKMKVLTKGKYLWMRTIGSTVVGEFVNTAVFYAIGLSGIIPVNALLSGIIAGWIFKTAVEILFTPITYLVIHWVKKIEHEDFYDRKTNFNPFI